MTTSKHKRKKTSTRKVVRRPVRKAVKKPAKKKTVHKRVVRKTSLKSVKRKTVKITARKSVVRKSASKAKSIKKSGARKVGVNGLRLSTRVRTAEGRRRAMRASLARC